MAGVVDDSPVTYEDLAQLEKEFEDVETEIGWLFFQAVLAICQIFYIPHH